MARLAMITAGDGSPAQPCVGLSLSLSLRFKLADPAGRALEVTAAGPPSLVTVTVTSHDSESVTVWQCPAHRARPAVPGLARSPTGTSSPTAR